MKRKIIALLVAGVFALGLGITAFAYSMPSYSYPASEPRYGYAGCYGREAGNRGMMWDEDGNFLDRGDFEQRLDGFIADGTIRFESRDSYLQMYDFFTAEGDSAWGMFGRGRGRMSGRRSGGGCGYFEQGGCRRIR